MRENTMTDVVIHVRFSSNGTVNEIGERPAGVSPQAWFNLLSEKTGGAYKTFAGGRGTFQLPRETVDALKGGVAA
jgi:hypothetical protein